MASCSLTPNSFSNFGVSTSKQCLHHFLAFPCRPCIRSTLYHCDQVCGGIQPMQTYNTRLRNKANPLLFFFVKEIVSLISVSLSITQSIIRPAAKGSQSLGTLVPRIMTLWEWFCWCW